MSKYQNTLISQSFRNAVVSGMLANTFLVSPAAHALQQTGPWYVNSSNYNVVTRKASESYEPREHSKFGMQAPSTGQELASIITDFYEKLSAQQEPLGQDFEKVLFDNLWDLYES